MNSMDIKAILDLLPHRYPFLMVDRITDYVPGERISGLKNVTVNEPFFQGHFPGEPIMPGVLLLEGMAQVGALLAYLSEPETLQGRLVYFAGLDKVRFRRKVVPGDQLLFELAVSRRKGKVWKMAGRTLVDGNVACEAELMATFG